MLLKYHWLFRIITGILASLFLTYFAYYFNEPSLLFTGLLFYLIGSLFTLCKREYRIFQVSYCWLVIFCVAQALFFQSAYLQIFDKGGDDRYFFEDWILLGYYDIDAVLTEYNPYKTFVLPAVYYLKFINFLGFGSTFSFHVNLINVFVGSMIPVFVYKTAIFFTTSRLAQFATVFVSFYPFLNYQSVKIMRDVDVYLLFTILIYLLTTNLRLLAKGLWILLIVFLMWNVRKEALIYIFILVGSFSFLQNKSILTRVTLVVLIFLSFGVVYMYVSTVYGLDLNSVIKFSQLYDDLRQETAGDSSIATMLKNAGFLGKVISVPYVWLSPLPPPILFSVNFMSLLISIGCLLWYYLMPRGVINLYNNTINSSGIEQRNLSLSICVTILIGSLFIAYTSGDPRHTLIFFPTFSIFCFGYFQNSRQKFELNLIYVTIFTLIVAILSYLYLKFLI